MSLLKTRRELIFTADISHDNLSLTCLRRYMQTRELSSRGVEITNVQIVLTVYSH